MFGGLANVGRDSRVSEHEREESNRTGTGSTWSESHEASPRRLAPQAFIGSASEQCSSRSMPAVGCTAAVGGFRARRPGRARAAAPPVDRNYRSVRPYIKAAWTTE